MEKSKLLVYGTLRRRNTDGKIVPATHVLPGYEMFNTGRFPYIVPKVGSNVVGNLLDVTQHDLEQYDVYEGAPSFYERVKVKVVPLEGGASVWCEVYVGGTVAEIGGEAIPSGDWAEH